MGTGQTLGGGAEARAVEDQSSRGLHTGPGELSCSDEAGRADGACRNAEDRQGRHFERSKMGGEVDELTCSLGKWRTVGSQRTSRLPLGFCGWCEVVDASELRLPCRPEAVDASGLHLPSSHDCILSVLIGQCIFTAIGVSDWSIVYYSMAVLSCRQWLMDEILITLTTSKSPEFTVAILH